MQQKAVQPSIIGAQRGALALLAALMLGILLMPNASAQPTRLAAHNTRPAQAARHIVHLPLVRTGDIALRPTNELIDAALEAGTITRETALLYKAQAVLDDPALPAAYRGSGAGDESAAMMATRTLSADMQARLQPYLLPPSAPESWYARNVMAGQAQQAGRSALAATPLSWQTVNTGNGKAKIWYHPESAGAAARAQQIAGEIDGRIWQKLAELFGRELPADCGASCVEGGGDGRLDIYLVNRGWNSGGSCCDFQTGHIELGTSSDNVWLARMIAAVWLDTVPVADVEEYGWMVVAMQAYAVHHVYPTNNYEHRWAERFLKQPGTSLEKQSYGAYLLFFDMMADRNNIVAGMLDQAMNPNSLAALDKAMENLLVERWSEFALHNWNTHPMDAYLTEDDLRPGAEVTHNYSIPAPGTYPYPIEVPHLAAHYVVYQGLDDTVRKVTFTNPIARDAVAGGHVWAIVNEGEDNLTIEDWSETARRTFCRDNPGENINGVVLIISNGNWQDRQAVMKTDNGLVEAEAQCGADASGTISWSFEEDTQSPGFERTVQEQATVQVRLRYDAETGQYVDDGSTYSFSGSSTMQQIDANGVGFRGSGTSTGSGPIASNGGGIGAHIEEGEPRHIVIGIQLPYRHQGTMTYLPSGATEPVSSEGVATLTCAEQPEYGDQLHGRATSEGGFDMSCTLNINQNGVRSLTTVTGSISIRPQQQP
jgi:hypothetical protein